MKRILRLFGVFLYCVYAIYDKYFLQIIYKCMLGYCGKDVTIRHAGLMPFKGLSRMYLYDNVTIKRVDLISHQGKFVMKKNSGSATGLTVITGNHHREVGELFIKLARNHALDIEKDVIIEEDVWIGANVTLLSGVIIGRGATIGAGSVCLRSVPPYAIVMGNPAKVVGFNFNPDEVIEHEKHFYLENERLPFDLLEKNFNKYYINRINEIKSFLKQ